MAGMVSISPSEMGEICLKLRGNSALEAQHKSCHVVALKSEIVEFPRMLNRFQVFTEPEVNSISAWVWFWVLVQDLSSTVISLCEINVVSDMKNVPVL